MRVVVYLGAIDPAGSADLVQQAQARAEGDGDEVAGVFWDPDASVPLDDRPGFEAAFGAFVDRDAGKLLFDPVTAVGDPELQVWQEPGESMRCTACGGTDVIFVTYRDQDRSPEEVCVTCRPDHAIAAWQRKRDR